MHQSKEGLIRTSASKSEANCGDGVLCTQEQIQTKHRFYVGLLQVQNPDPW